MGVCSLYDGIRTWSQFNKTFTSVIYKCTHVLESENNSYTDPRKYPAQVEERYCYSHRYKPWVAALVQYRRARGNVSFPKITDVKPETANTHKVNFNNN